MKTRITSIALFAALVMSALPARASEEPEDTTPSTVSYAVEVLTDFPLHVGVGARVELAHGLRVHTSLGVMPGPYLDSINALCTEFGWYDQLTADLISSAFVRAVMTSPLLIIANWSHSASASSR